MTVDKVLEYIQMAPQRVNIQVIRSMLEELAQETEAKTEIEPLEIKELNVSKNGIYTAPEGKAYGKVIVNIKENKKN